MPPAAAEPTFLLLLLIATAAFGQPTAEDVLARVPARYAGKSYHDVRFAPDFSIERFTREHGVIAMMLVNALVLVAAFVFCRITDHPGVTAAARTIA